MKKLSLNLILNILLIGIIGIYIGRYFYMKPKFINGEKAPDFSAALIHGSQFSLSKLRGRYVLLDFWGSWCGPCREENPKLVALYREFKRKRLKKADGFEIVSVGIENHAPRWSRAIENDGMIWPYHILDVSSNMKFFNSPIAQLYGVKQIPTKYLINPEGRIIGVNLSTEKIRAILEKEIF